LNADASPFAALGNGLVAQADHDNGPLAAGQLDLDVDGALHLAHTL
jgi:hypothetical protein